MGEVLPGRQAVGQVKPLCSMGSLKLYWLIGRFWRGCIERCCLEFCGGMLISWGQRRELFQAVSNRVRAKDRCCGGGAVADIISRKGGCASLFRQVESLQNEFMEI